MPTALVPKWVPWWTTIYRRNLDLLGTGVKEKESQLNVENCVIKRICSYNVKRVIGKNIGYWGTTSKYGGAYYSNIFYTYYKPSIKISNNFYNLNNKPTVKENPDGTISNNIDGKILEGFSSGGSAKIPSSWGLVQYALF